MRRPHREAFTIIELLVVIGVLGLLMGLLLPGLRAAHRKGLKSTEMNAIKQVGIAWQLYSMNNKDQVLPGFLDTAVQERWQVKYQFNDHSTIPPAPGYGLPNVAGPWTWRLMPQLSHSHDMVHGYLDEPEYDPTTISGDAPEVWRMAYEPGFGYNAKYVGGWWTMIDNVPFNGDFDGNGQISGQNNTPGEATSVELVVRSVASIKRSSELVIFCSSTLLDPGTYHKLPDDRKGAHYVVPPKVGPDQQWFIPASAGGADVTTLMVERQSPVPFGRYNNLAATLCADLHTEANNLQALSNMRRWIDRADTFDFEHP